MGKLWKYCLSVAVCCWLISCQKEADVLYKRLYTEQEVIELAKTLIEGGGNSQYYQGSVNEVMLVKEGLSLDPNNAHGWRELGVPYLKRGFAHEAYQNYTKASELDPENWQGYMAYCWLYFYRDYTKVLELVEEYDALTPDFVDYPQSTSVDYMRGISYYHLQEYDKAIFYLDKHLQYEIAEVGEAYISTVPWIALAKSYQDSGDLLVADSIYQKALVSNANCPELHFYHATNLYKMGKNAEAKNALVQATEWLKKGGGNNRPYVEEFFAIYPQQIEHLKGKLGD